MSSDLPPEIPSMDKPSAAADGERSRDRSERDRSDRDGSPRRGSSRDRKREDRDRDSHRSSRRSSRSRSREHRRRYDSRDRSRSKERRRRRSRSRSDSRDRHRSSRSKNWDQPPAAGVMPTAMPTAAAPGTAFNPSVVASLLANISAPPGAPSGLFGRISGPPPGSVRPCRRVYCGNVAPHVTEATLKKFLNDVITSVPERPADWPRDAIQGIVMKREKNFCFIDFFAGEDADIAMQLDGIDFDPHTQLKFRRTKEYVETHPPAKQCKYIEHSSRHIAPSS